MKAIIEREGKIHQTNYLKVIIGKKEFRIEETPRGLCITKVDFDENQMSILPGVSNQITIS